MFLQQSLLPYYDNSSEDQNCLAKLLKALALDCQYITK